VSTIPAPFSKVIKAMGLTKNGICAAPAIPGVKKFSINTKEYSNIFKMLARTILAFFFNVSSPYESYNSLN